MIESNSAVTASIDAPAHQQIKDNQFLYYFLTEDERKVEELARKIRAEDFYTDDQNYDIYMYFLWRDFVKETIEKNLIVDYCENKYPISDEEKEQAEKKRIKKIARKAKMNVEEVKRHMAETEQKRKLWKDYYLNVPF